MPKYRIEGEVYDAANPTSAYILHQNRMEGGEVNATTGESFGSNLLSGIGSGMVNVGRQAGNVLGLVDDETIQQQGKTDEALLDTGAGQVGRLIGEVAATAPAGGLIGAGTKALAARALPQAIKGLAPTLGLGAEGAAEGYVLGGPGNREQGAILGGGMGGGLGVLGAAGSKLMRGTANIPASARQLLDEGVDLTPGQIHPSGLMAGLEETYGKFSGNVGRARQQSIDDATRAMMRRAVPDGGVAPRMGGDDLVGDLDELYKSFDGAYAPAKGHRMVAADIVTGEGLPQMLQRQIKAHAGSDPIMRQREAEWIAEKIADMKPSTTSDDLLRLRTKVRNRIREKGKKPNADTDHLDILEMMEETISETLMSQLPADVAKALKRTDAKYANYKVVEDIMASRSDRAMTVDAMRRGVEKAQGRGVDRGSYARGADLGTGSQRDIVNQSIDALSDGTPKTGFAAMLPAAVGLAGYATGGGPLAAALATGGAASIPMMMAGTRTGRQAYRGALKPQQALQKTMDQIRGGLDYANPALRAGAISYGQGDN